MYLNLSPGAVGMEVTLEESIPLAARHGFEGIDLPLAAVAAVPDVDAIQQKMSDAGLRWGGFPLPVQFLGDQETFERDLAALDASAALAERVGCDRCCMWIMPGSNDLDHDANLDLHVTRLTPIAKALGEHGVRLGLEFIGPKTLREQFKHPFIHTMPKMLEMCDAISPSGGPPVGLLLDCFHWWTSGATEADLLTRLTNERIVYVHVNDGRAGRTRDEQLDLERALPCDTGLIDAATFVKALHTLKYDGPIAAEPFIPELGKLPPDQNAERTITSMRKMMALA